MSYSEVLASHRCAFGILSLIRIFIRFCIFASSRPTAMGLTCSSSPTTIIFLPMYRIAEAVISDWLASSTMITSNWVFVGSIEFITLETGIIHAGTAFWHSAISFRASARRPATRFPVPFPIFAIVCFHPFSACRTPGFLSIRCCKLHQASVVASLSVVLRY